jgi:hypothetical protein
MQIESRIDQKPEISQAFTLWGQAGSKVIRGNLLIIPVKDSLVYVEPIYLQAEQSELPELKRVIVGYQDRIEMGLDLEDALSRVFGARGAGRGERAETVAARKGVVESVSINELIRKAGAYYEEAQRKLRAGDFAGYGDSVKKLGEVIDQLQKRSR